MTGKELYERQFKGLDVKQWDELTEVDKLFWRAEAGEDLEDEDCLYIKP